MAEASDNNNSFSKTICSICYEDLKPIVEDLQSISICGHVFHELCLQQWFEYCTNAKKQSCPVCKQGCTKKNVGRLYFQSMGDSVLTQCHSENAGNNRGDGNGEGDCPEILRVEVKRLASKVSNLNSALDSQHTMVKQLTDELHICKEQLSEEETLKIEAVKTREIIEAILRKTSNDLVKSSTECSKLQEKNKALFKELAAMKLASDCNLEEEEIVKLAYVAHDGNMHDAIDVLKKSLVIRNKSYKDLMAKCNVLGRGEDRYRRKLEKAKEKMVKLKTRVQELETAIEAKDNEVLRLLKESKKRNRNEVPNVNISTNSPSVLKPSSLGEKGQSSASVINLDDDCDTHPFEGLKTRKNDANGTIPFEFLIDDECELKTSVDIDKQKGGSSKPADFSFSKDSMDKSSHQFPSSSSAGLINDVVNGCSSSKEAAGLHLQDIRQVQPSVHTKSDASVIPLVEPGDLCFAGGLLGPDGGNRYLGKWCKRVQNGSSNGTNSLIAVGGDGRGGKVKVLRPLSQPGMDTKESNSSAKRFKPGGKPSGSQSQGCLQIEHFFGKARS